jgi:photosystem II stability/assembly factor-like uncharacterized protein
MMVSLSKHLQYLLMLIAILATNWCYGQDNPWQPHWQNDGIAYGPFVLNNKFVIRGIDIDETFISDDNGNSWKWLAKDYSPGNRMTVIDGAIHQNGILDGSQPSEAFVSFDEGLTWEPHNGMGLYPTNIAEDTYIGFGWRDQSANTVTFKYSTDNGATSIDLERSQSHHFAYSTFYTKGYNNSILTFHSNKIYRSTNLLITEAEIKTLPGQVNQVFQLESENIYVTFADIDTVLKSTDHGLTWEEIAIPHNEGWIRRSIYELDDSTTYFALAEKVGQLPWVSKLYVKNGVNGYLELVKDVNNNDVGFNGGYFSFHAIAYIEDVVLFTHGRSIARSEDKGETWRVLTKGGDHGFEGHMDFYDNVNGLIGNKHYLRTKNGGISWDTLGVSQESNGFIVSAPDKAMLFNETFNVTTDYTLTLDLNSGDTILNGIKDSEFEPVIDYDFQSIQQRELFVTAISNLPDGLTYRIHVNSSHEILDSVVSSINDPFEWFSLFRSGIKSGENWIGYGWNGYYIKKPNSNWEITHSTSNGAMTFFKTINNENHIVSGRNKLYLSTNGGETWVQGGSIPVKGIQVNEVKFFAFALDDIWVAGRNEIAHTTDAGASWEVHSIRQGEDIQRLWCTQPGSCFAITLDKLYQTRQSLDIVGQEEFSNAEQTFSSDFVALPIYPNPCLDCETIYFNTTAEIEEVKVYDINGALILSSESVESHSLKLPSNLSPGVYFLKAHLAQGKTVYSKLVVN